MEAIEPTARPAARGGAVRRPWWRWSARFVHGYLSRLKHGCIALQGPGDAKATFGDPTHELRATMTIHDPRFFWRAVAGGDIGFGESYMDGDWSCDDLTTLIHILAINRDELDGLNVASALPRRLLSRAYHLTRRNTVAGNRRNIQDHYDLGNEFFRLFLDPSMTYSCAVFPTGNESLETAQRLKIQAMIDKAEIAGTDHVLEIGSGWGSLAIEAVQQTGCRVTTLTLSDEQKQWVQHRVAEAGLQDRIDVRITDYRRIEGEFDRIVSVEMLEAVGHENLAPYFAACDRLLRYGGRAVIQVITIRDEYYDGYRKGCDFIQRHIFPGGHLPSWGALSQAISTATARLSVENVEDIGHHYARTLREWRNALNANAERVFALGFDHSFLRKWNYYFSYCEAGFRTRTLGNLQFVLTK
jgi:cyclopropane-fatty-acyl-phospholipid synthase